MVKIRLEDDFYVKRATVFGLVTELPDHRLSFLINNDLDLKLSRTTKDRELYWKGKTYGFTEFSFDHPVLKVFWFLTSNKGKSEVEETAPTNLQSTTTIPLVADLKSFDYFLWFDDEELNEVEEVVNLRLKKLSYVRAFQKIEISRSKNINNLLLEY